MQTSVSGIFAAGDCMEWNGASLGIIPVALDTAKVAAQNMLNYGSTAYEGTIPSNTLQVVGIDLTSVGLINPQTPDYESVVMSDQTKGTYFKAVMKNHVVVGGIALGDRKVALRLRQLITSRTDVSGLGESIFKS
jgi:nitrite reductase (NADH) large subunit